MKKIILLAAIAFSLSASAQDSTQKKEAPKVYLLQGNAQSFELLKTVLLQSKLSLNGEQLSAAQIIELLNWINTRQVATKIEQAEPKKKK
jgi:hypothetical protein